MQSAIGPRVGPSAAEAAFERDLRLVFEASPEVLLVLLPDAPTYTMVGATEARLAATHTRVSRLWVARCSSCFRTIPTIRGRPGPTTSGRR